jgi:hypothetical protein
VFAAARSDNEDLVAVLAGLPTAALAADERMVASLPWPLRFLVEPVLLPAAEPSNSRGHLKGRFQDALRQGHCVIAFSDNPPHAPPQRCRFRLEPLEAAMESGAAVIPVLVEGTVHNGHRREGGKRLVVRWGQPVASGSARFPAAALRDKVRHALGTLASVSEA